MNGFFTHEILQDLVDWCDPSMIMQLSILPAMKTLLANPYHLRRLSTRFGWYIKLFDDFAWIYETKFYTEHWHRHFDYEYRAVLAVQSRDLPTLKICIDEIISSGRIRNKYLIFDLQNTAIANHLFSSEDLALCDYCFELDHVKKFIDEKKSKIVDPRSEYTSYRKHVFHRPSELVKLVNRTPVLAFDLSWTVIRTESIDLFRYLESQFEKTGNSGNLIMKLLRVDAHRFIGAVLSSRDPRIYDLLSPYIFARQDHPFYFLLPQEIKEGNFSGWIFKAIESCDIVRIKLCSESGRVDRVFQGIKATKRSGLRNAFTHTIQMMITLHPSHQLIFDVTQIIPVEDRGLWLEILVDACILNVKVDLLQYLLTTMGGQATGITYKHTTIQPCCLKIIIRHSHPRHSDVVKCIESLRDFCAPETIKELENLAQNIAI